MAPGIVFLHRLRILTGRPALFLSLLLVSCEIDSPAEMYWSEDSCEKILERAELDFAHCGILAVDLRSGRTVLEHNSRKLFIPASTLKLFTTYAALLEFGPDYKFETRLWARRGKTEDSVALQLALEGTGDPFLLDTQWQDQVPAPWLWLADRLLEAGIVRIDGPLIADGSRFGEALFASSWSLEDLDLYHGPPVSALNAGHNVFRIEIMSGSKVGSSAEVLAYPDLGSYYRIRNEVTTTAGKDRQVTIRRSRDDGSLQIGGRIGLASDPLRTFCTVTSPPRFAANWLLQVLEARGVEVTGGVVTGSAAAVDSAMELMGTIESEPLNEIVKRTNKESDNLGAECLARMFLQDGRRGATLAAAIENLQHRLAAEGFPNSPPFRMADGSGLSRENLVAPAHLVWLLAHAAGDDRGEGLIVSLAISGSDARLRDHPVSDELPGKVLAKTGSLTSVHCLAGYYLDGVGEPMYAFAVMTNGLPDGLEPALRAERLVISRLRALAVVSELRPFRS